MAALSNRKYVLAVDGGQSSTLALACDDQGTILGTGHGGPANHYHEPGGPERLESAMRSSTEEALRVAHLTPDAISHICLGMTGSMEHAKHIVQTQFAGAAVESLHDVVTALVGASVAKPGVVVIAGTGAIAYGRLADGREARSGGWGYIMGDEGSGYWIGIEAIRAACKAEDGRGAATELVWRIPQRLAAPDLYELQRRVYANRVSRREIASLAQIVAEAAQNGDTVAQRLLLRGGEELAQAALGVIAHLDHLAVGLDIYTTGGVFEAGRLIRDSFDQAIVEHSPNSRVHPARFSPVIGALFLALEAAGVILKPAILNQISITMPASAKLK
jgi:glucosamine kinase